MSNLNRAGIFVVGLCAATCLTQQAQSGVGERLLLIEVEDLREETDTGLLIDAFYFLAHDENFNLYNHGQPAPEGLAWFANEGMIDEIQDELIEQSPDAWTIIKVNSQPPHWSGAITQAIFFGAPWVFPESTRYLTVLGRVYPSDDAFFANEDPQRYELFDEDGVFLGPFVIDIYGTDIMDAGTRDNEEIDLLWLDRDIHTERGDEPWVRTEDEVVRPHPGFKGSFRNPSEVPGRLMSQVNTFCPPSGDECHDFEPESIDFTRPGYKLARIRITTESQRTLEAMVSTLHGPSSGSYFDPERSGEGFSFEFTGSKPNRVVMYWYTYKPDGSGEQQWLVGTGIKDPSRGFFDLDLFTTQGGRLTSTDNPVDVEVIPWGSARLWHDGGPGVPACTRLSLEAIEPLDPAIELDLPNVPSTRYSLSRVTPFLTGLEKYCGNHSGMRISDAFLPALP